MLLRLKKLAEFEMQHQAIEGCYPFYFEPLFVEVTFDEVDASYKGLMREALATAWSHEVRQLRDHFSLPCDFWLNDKVPETLMK